MPEIVWAASVAGVEKAIADIQRVQNTAADAQARAQIASKNLNDEWGSKGALGGDFLKQLQTGLQTTIPEIDRGRIRTEELTRQLAEGGRAADGSVKAITGMGLSVEQAGKHALTAGAHLANVFAPGISGVAEMTNFLTGSGGLVPGLAALGVAVVAVTHVMDHWYDSEERLAASEQARIAANNAGALQAALDYKKQKARIDETREDELALDVLREQMLRNLLLRTKAQADAEMRDLSKSNEEREDIKAKQKNIDQQIAASDIRANKDAADKAVAVHREAQKEIAAASQEKADKIRQIEDLNVTTRVAQIGRERTVWEGSIFASVELIKQRVSVENAADKERASHGSDEDIKLSEIRRSNRRAEADVEIKALKDAALERMDAFQKEAEARAVAGAKAINDRKLIAAEAVNRQSFNEGRDSTLAEMQSDAEANHAIEAQHEKHAQAILEIQQKVTVAERAVRIHAMADIEVAAAISEDRIAKTRIKYAEANDQISHEDANRQRARITQDTDDRIALIKDEADFDVEQEQRKQDAKDLTAKAAMIAAAADTAYGAATMVVTPIVGALNEQIGKLTALNRDNAKEMFKQAEDMPAIVAMKTQAILIGLAQEAGGKAVTTGLDAAKEVGMGIGSGAIGDAAGASAHFSAAAQLGLTAAGYAAFAGVSLGAGVGIGLVRPATKEEKDKGSSAGSVGGGASYSSSGGGSTSQSSGGPIIFNNTTVYGAGSIPPQDSRVAAARVVDLQRRAADDGWAQMGRASG